MAHCLIMVPWQPNKQMQTERKNQQQAVLCDRMSAEEATSQNMQSEDATLSPKEKLSPEAESISRVVINCISQVKIAVSLPAILQFYSKSALDQDLSRALQTHQVLAERLEKLEGQQQKQTKKEKGKMVQLKNDMKNSVRDVLRYFRTHPVVLSDVRAELNVEVGESESMFIEMLEKFHNQTTENLISGPDKNTHKVLQRQAFSSSGKGLHDFIPKEKNVDKTLKQLNELERLKEEIFSKQSTIAKLQYDLDILEKQGKKRSAPSEQQDEPKSSSKPTSLNQETDQLNAQLNNLMIKNQQTQRILREENKMLEMEIESLLQTFNENIKELQAELQEVVKKYEKDQEDVTKLQVSFSLLEVQSNEIQERWRLAEEMRKEELRLLEWKSKAAVAIQAWWRGCSVRNALKNKDKSKKDKKSKKSNSKGNSRSNSKGITKGITKGNSKSITKGNSKSITKGNSKSITKGITKGITKSNSKKNK